MTWLRNRYAGAAAILLATTGGAVALATADGPQAKPPDLRTQIEDRMRTVLERSDPGQHRHAGHATTEQAKTPVVCGVHVYGHEPAEATTIAGVRTVYGFHLCGLAEQKRPWDVAVKLAGPLILDLSADPPDIRVVEATADVKYIDKLKQMFPDRYAELAQKEALADAEMADLRRRYDAAAGL